MSTFELCPARFVTFSIHTMDIVLATPTTPGDGARVIWPCIDVENRGRDIVDIALGETLMIRWWCEGLEGDYYGSLFEVKKFGAKSFVDYCHGKL